jgi:MraZ protein
VGQSGIMLFGSYQHFLDDKGRLVIPSQLRINISDKLFVLKGYEGSLRVFPQEAFNTYLSHLAELDSESKLARDVQRVALASVVELSIDSKNRVQLPQSLIEKYNISNNVVVVGMLDHLEIWNADLWEKYSKENEYRFEEKSEELLSK